jgi:hypothetical protein
MAIEAHCIVSCDEDGCKESIEATLTETVTGAGNSWDDRNISKELADEGWSVQGGEYFCPTHTEKEEEEDEEE